MIIRKKWKYSFMRLPFSTSPEISKELVEHYDGHPFFRRHTNSTDLKRQGAKISEYVAFPTHSIFSLNNCYLNEATFLRSSLLFFQYNQTHIDYKRRLLDLIFYHPLQSIRFWNWKKEDRVLQLYRSVDDYDYLRQKHLYST